LPEKESENIPDFVSLAKLKKNGVFKWIFCINSVLDNSLHRFFKISRYLLILILSSSKVIQGKKLLNISYTKCEYILFAKECQ
jgi:hypothetical protein